MDNYTEISGGKINGHYNLMIFWNSSKIAVQRPIGQKGQCKSL